MMELNQPTDGPLVCPECGALRIGDQTFCWLCRWKAGDPVRVRVHGKNPPTANPYASPMPPGRGNLHWTFSLSTLFLWTALVAVVMGVIRIAPGLGIPLAIFSLPAALYTVGLAAQQQRKTGRPTSVLQKLHYFFMSLTMAFVLTFAIGIAAFGALAVVCMAAMAVSPRGNQGQIIAALISVGIVGAAVLAVIVYIAVRLIRQLRK